MRVSWNLAFFTMWRDQGFDFILPPIFIGQVSPDGITPISLLVINLPRSVAFHTRSVLFHVHSSIPIPDRDNALHKHRLGLPPVSSILPLSILLITPTGIPLIPTGTPCPHTCPHFLLSPHGRHQSLPCTTNFIICLVIHCCVRKFKNWIVFKSFHAYNIKSRSGLLYQLVIPVGIIFPSFVTHSGLWTCQLSWKTFKMQF